MKARSWQCLGSFLLITLLPEPAVYGQEVKVDGANVSYPQTVTLDEHKLRLTGTGIRKKFVFNVYTIASYIDANSRVSSAETLASIDAPKRLHLVMERSVTGKKMADAFQKAIPSHQDKPDLKEGVAQLTAYLSGTKAEKKHHIIFDYIPKKGLTVSITGQKPITIPGLSITQALWNIYLGPHNISSSLKKSITQSM